MITIESTPELVTSVYERMDRNTTWILIGAGCIAVVGVVVILIARWLGASG